MGMQCECPQCGTAFIIPTIEHPASAAQSMDADELHADIPGDGLEAAAGMLGADAGLGEGLSPGELAASELGHAAGEELLHIPCPNGHELETPVDMLGQYVQCPQCGVQFRLRRERSVEHRHELEILDRKRARFWFQLSIMAATFVTLIVLVLIGMIIFS